MLVNTRARAGGLDAAQAAQALSASGVRVEQADRVPEPEALPGLVRRAVADGARLVVVGGGDGSLQAAANELAHTGVALGVVPLGTGNDFARSLGLPLEPQAALAAIATGRRRRVDLGRVNGRAFLNAVSFGLSGAITRRLRPELKRRAGPLAYPLAAAAAATEAAPFRLQLETRHGRTLDLEALHVVVGNGRYHGGGRLVAPWASLTGSHLDVWVMAGPEGGQTTAGRLWSLARLALLMRRGRHLAHPAVRYLATRALRVRTSPSKTLDADGEPAGTTPARLESDPRALTVVVPARGRG